MENILTPEIEVMIAAFVAVLAANALKWFSRFITNWVRGTPNKIDDKIWAAIQDALGEVNGKNGIKPTGTD